MDYISGSSGFLGSHLAKRLPEATRVPHKDLAYITASSAGTFYFLSTYGNSHTQTDPSQALRANIYDLLDVLQNTQVDNFVYISTSSVNLKEQNPYSRTKRAAEEIVQAFRSACIIRPYSITGVGEQREHLIPTLIRSCMTGERMDFVPWATHDFIDVEDVVDAILALSRRHRIFEIGSGESRTNQQVLDMVEKITGKKANINVVSALRPYDTGKWPVAQPAWRIKRPLEQSIAEMVASYAHVPA
jgi:nucleoside-diphosphate-sugar epimerase